MLTAASTVTLGITFNALFLQAVTASVAVLTTCSLQFNSVSLLLFFEVIALYYKKVSSYTKIKVRKSQYYARVGIYSKIKIKVHC